MPGASDCYGKGVKGRLDMDDKISQAIAARGSVLPEDAVDRRIREIEAREAEERAQRTTRTATQPASADWICVARAGRDGQDVQTPIVRGTYAGDAT
jgi:hypothetical protein